MEIKNKLPKQFFFSIQPPIYSSLTLLGSSSTEQAFSSLPSAQSLTWLQNKLCAMHSPKYLYKKDKERGRIVHSSCEPKKYTKF